MAIFNHKYWPDLDNPGEWKRYQVNTITNGVVSIPGLQISVLGRQLQNEQTYITIWPNPLYPSAGLVYSGGNPATAYSQGYSDFD